MKCSCGSDNYVKYGYFRPRSNNYQPIPRYLCKDCDKTFSRQTNAVTCGQKKPQINQEILKWYSSGNTQRRMAEVMGVNRKTIIRKFLFLADLAKKEHERVVKSGELKTGFVQFDEIETFEHTRLKPLSIAIAVRAKTGQIIAAKVASMNCKGKAAPVSLAKYGLRKDERNQAMTDVMAQVTSCAREQLTVMSDSKTAYTTLMKRLVPNAVFEQTPRAGKGPVNSASRKNKKDKMFTLNYTAAKLRNDLSRLARKTWVTTKKPDRLQAHLDLYIAFNNGYDLAV